MRSRRSGTEEGGDGLDVSWTCPTCTFRNLCSLYSCEVCETKKPTSRGRGSNSIVRTEEKTSDCSSEVSPPPSSNGTGSSSGRSRSKSPESLLQSALKKHRRKRAKLSDLVDFSNFTTAEITVGDKTVVITDYRLKKFVLGGTADDANKEDDCSNQSAVSSSSGVPSSVKSNSSTGEGGELGTASSVSPSSTSQGTKHSPSPKLLK